MANICHTFSTRSAAEHLRSALTTLEGLRAWWTDGTSGDPGQGGTLAFRFGDNGGFDMQVVRSDDTHVEWECVGGPDDWLGTRIEFEIQPSDAQTKLMFRHAGWRSENSFLHHCSTKWATFLLSLKAYLENGRGQPFPHDIKIEASGM